MLCIMPRLNCFQNHSQHFAFQDLIAGGVELRRGSGLQFLKEGRFEGLV